uniref:Uncharacterized protein n=1 Tax=Gossypium raimondii TaxID=29730 RepID=A0A0D2S5T5_GOSRA|nr:hypothetical protein B456_013G000100 [Gossypium raimondii]
MLKSPASWESHFSFFITDPEKNANSVFGIFGIPCFIRDFVFRDSNVSKLRYYYPKFSSVVHYILCSVEYCWALCYWAVVLVFNLLLWFLVNGILDLK